jgi:hypothetical protein
MIPDVLPGVPLFSATEKFLSFLDLIVRKPSHGLMAESLCIFFRGRLLTITGRREEYD